MMIAGLLPRAPTPTAIAAANHVLATLFAGGVMSVRVAFFSPEDGQRRYWAAVTARRTATGAVAEERRPRRLVVHPARTFGCSGGGPLADPKMPLPPYDRLWVLALRNFLDGLAPGVPGQRLPADALAWLAAHPTAFPAAATLTLSEIQELLEKTNMMPPAITSA